MHFHPQPRKSRAAAAPIAPLVEIARRVLPFTAADGQAFARIPIPSSGGFFIHPIRSAAFRDWFLANYFGDHDALPSTRAYALLLNHLEAQAAYADSDLQRLNVFRRVGSRGPNIIPSQILLDLANPEGQFVEISPSSWQVSAGVNALLQTSRATRDIPVPVATPDPTADLAILRSCLNLPSRADWLRCLAWLMAAFRPAGPFPFLVLQGPPGAGKTFAARLLRTLIDPASTPLSPVPHNTRHLFALARQNWVLAFDHISNLSPQLCDSLCRLTTSAGVSVRETPLSDVSREPLLQNCRRPMLFTVTGRFSPPHDFAARALTVTLPEIPSPRLRSETDLLTVFSNSFPQILGALCTAVATALARVPDIHLTEAPRLADALLWAMAAAPALDCTEQELRQALLPPPADLLLQSIQTLLAQTPTWTGPTTTLFQLLPPSVRSKCPQELSRQLRNRIDSLAAAGITLNFTRSTCGARLIVLQRSPFDASFESVSKTASKLAEDPPQPNDRKDLIAA